MEYYRPARSAAERSVSMRRSGGQCIPLCMVGVKIPAANNFQASFADEHCLRVPHVDSVANQRNSADRVQDPLAFSAPRLLQPGGVRSGFLKESDFATILKVPANKGWLSIAMKLTFHEAVLIER